MRIRPTKLFLKAGLACAICLALPGAASAFTVTTETPTVVEGNTGTTAVEFDVACEAGEVGSFTFTAKPGATPGATSGTDFEEPASGTLLPCALLPISAGTVTVNVVGDTVDELNENFVLEVTLGSATKSVPVTITDDDTPVARAIEVVRVAEGDTGAVDALVEVTLDQATAEDVSIGYSTENNTAVAGEDYTAASGQMAIPAGQSKGTISVPVVGDTAQEQVEFFFVNLLSTNGKALVDGTKRQTAVVIFDTDKAPLPSISLPQSVTVKEGDAGTGNVLFEVSLNIPATERAEVAWRTTDWTADEKDYRAASGTLVFAAGQRTKTISVDVKGDRRDEPDEAFTVALENPVAATIARKGAFGIITDDDGPKVKIGKPKQTRKRLVATVSCPATASKCTGRLVGKAGTLKLGRAKFDLAKGQTATLRLKLSKTARAALAKRGRRGKLEATAADASGAKRVTTRKIRLKRL